MESANEKRSLPTTLGRDAIGRYELIYPIGHGGMASVHVGRLSSLAGFEKLVAIKVIHPHLSSTPEFVDMFLDEARLAAGIHHPNVGEMYEVGEDQGLFFMVGEFVNGQSLHNFYKRSWELGVNIPYALTADIMANACHGLHAAHDLQSKTGESLNLVHRDISPRNILLSYTGFVKLIDFGVAWAKERSSHTEVGVVKGKPGYMSPEQLRAEPLDRRSDIFSMGITFYQMLTGMHPFPGATDLERMYKVLRGTYKFPSIVEPDVPPKLERIIVKALAPRPSDRYSTAAEMAQDLEEYLRSEDCEVGHAPLARLMRWLFAEEHLDHDKQLREYRKAWEMKSSVPSASPLRTSSSANPEPYPPEATATDVDERSRGPKGMLPRLRWMVLGAGAAAIFVTASVLLGRNLDHSPPIGDGQTRVPLNSLTSQQIEDRAASDAKKRREVTQTVKKKKKKKHTIILDVVPKNTTVVLDGKPLAHGVEEFRLLADKKPHKLLFSAKGYRSLTKKLIVDRDKVVSVRLKPLPPYRPTRKKKNKKKESMKLKSSPY